MAAADRTVRAQQRQAGQRKIADHVEHLVTDAFVGEAQAFGVEQAVVVEHHRIVERGAERETGAPQAGDIVHAAEGAGARDVAAEALRVEVENVVLAADDRIGEIDFDFGAEARGVWANFAERIADRDLDRLEHLDEAAAGGLLDDAGLINGGDEGGGGAVHDRHFRAIDFDGGVIDAHAAQGCENVFGGGNQRTFAIAEHGGKGGGGDGFGVGGDFAVRTIEAGTDKNKACIDRRGGQGQTDGQTGMDADTRDGGLRPKRCLTTEFHSNPTCDSLRSADRRFRSPRVAATIPAATKCANSRFFTDCYPTSAAFEPSVDRLCHRFRLFQIRANPQTPD